MYQTRLNPMTGYQQREQDAIHNAWQGDLVTLQKPESTIRLMFHNVNHLPLHGITGFDNFVSTQSDLQVDIQAFSEHCLDTTKFRVIHQAQTILRHTYPYQATFQLDSSSEQALSDYKPGGTGILVLGDATSRLESQGRGGDPLGRWSYISFRRKWFPPVTVVSVYQVCPRPTNTIGNTAYHQQQRALVKQGRNIHPRQAFLADLQSFLEKLREAHHDILVGGDFNESLNDRNSGLLQMANRLQLIDPFITRFPDFNEFGTHRTGTRRIDNVLITPGLMPGIQRIGYAPFEYSTQSDHRPLLLEIKTSVFFGTDTAYMIPPQNRALKTKDKMSVISYVNALFTDLSAHRAFQHISPLEDNSATIETVERLDALIGICEEKAEKAIRKRRPEYYSRTIVKHRIEVAILKQHLRALQNERDITEQLLGKMERTGVHIQLPLTRTLTRAALKTAILQLRKTRQTSFETRQAELDRRIQEACESKNRPKHKILSAIRKVESHLKTFRILKAMRKVQTGLIQLDRIEIPASWPPPLQQVPSLDSLEDPKTCREWRLVTEPQEVEYYLNLRNRLHFGQAEGTPFTEPELSTVLDWQATSETAQAILEGSYLASSAHQQVQQLLRACQTAAPPDSIPHEMSYDEFAGKIRAWRETTTTSPSGRHLGRYKALFSSIPEDYTEVTTTETTFADKQESIARLKLSIINYCLRNTHVLERWKTVVNVMIFKEAGNYQIHRLRVIHLYEADLNAILAVKWRQLLHIADATGTINEGQFGGRPGCEAQFVTLLEELKYDASYLSRRSLFNFDNDAASCYDRIVVPLASLINRKYGQHRKTVAFHATTLQQAKFRLKTLNGISDTYYSHSNEFPIHGTGQGSGNSPCIWLFISSTLFDVHKAQAHGTKFVSPCGQHTVNMAMVGFVDDSTGSCNDFQPQTQAPIHELFSNMQHDAQLWNDLLHCSGGKLELTKCSYHFLHFEFDPNGTPRPTLIRHENQIHIREATTLDEIPIAPKTVLETHKTLGHHKAPYTPKPDISILKTRALQIALAIAMSPIPREGAFLAYNTVFIPTIKYTLPQSFYPKRMLEEAQAASLHRILPKCGFNRHTARAILFAPQTYAGGGFLPWHMMQGEGQITNFLKHWRTESLVSNTLRIVVSWSQWQSGHSRPILEDVHTALPHLEGRWLPSLREFLSHISATIRVDAPDVVQPERHHDFHIMTYALEAGIFSKEDLRVINYCRLYLHVTTLSEIFEADGKTLNYHVFQCQREPWFNPATYVALQQRPSNYHIRTKWQRLCREWVNSSGHIAASLTLGKWKISGEQLRRRRETYLIPGAHPRIFHWRFGQYWEYRQATYDTRIYVPYQSSSWLPIQTCWPVQAKQKHPSGTILVPHRLPLPSPPAQIHHPTTFHQYVLTLQQWEQHLLIGIHLRRSPYEIIHDMTRIHEPSTMIAVSDGSQQGTAVTFGWVVGNHKEEIYAEHSGFGYGTPSSHRAEAWGFLSMVSFVHHLHAYTRSNPAEMPISLATYSDNAGMILSLNKRRQYQTPYPNSTLAPDWDLLEQIHTVISRFPRDTLSINWVRGHQDEGNDSLTTEAKFNVLADKLAATVQIPPTNLTIRPPWLMPSERCQLVLSGRSIHAHYVKEIRHAYTIPPLLEYLTLRHQWGPKTHEEIDWSSYTQAVSTTTIPRHQLTKLVFDKLPTRYELAKSNRALRPNCPYCGELETFRHITRCHNPVSSSFRSNLYADLQSYFSRHGVPTYIQDFILTYLKHKVLSSETNSTKPALASNDITKSQEAIGWSLFVKGYMSKEWRRSLEDAHRRTTGNDLLPSKTIVAGLINKLWTAQHKLWQDYTKAQGSQHDRLSYRFQDKSVEYATRIRLLHHEKHKCLYRHQAIYFHGDIESFLEKATIQQMKQYLLHYEPVIEQSIKAAQRTPMRSLFSFFGITSRHQHQPTPIAPPIIRTNFRPKCSSKADGATPHKHTRWKWLQPVTTPEATDQPEVRTFPHKHSRWKVAQSLQPITKYFTPSTGHNSTPP